MPVSTAMNGGIEVCGLTSVWNSPSTSPPRTLTAPISVIIEPAWAEPPVVSRSTTQKVMSRRGRPSSSKASICADHLLMSSTLGSRTDKTVQAGPTRRVSRPDRLSVAAAVRVGFPWIEEIDDERAHRLRQLPGSRARLS